ncbi:MAG: TIGR02281 family clan AA aspartic protease [Aliishimia sp.]
MEEVSTDQVLGALFLSLFAIAILLSLGVRGLHKNLQNAAIWGLIFLGTIAGFGLWEDINDDVIPKHAVFVEQGKIEVPRAFDGHYYLTLRINGTPVDFVVDTGASQIVLTHEDAMAIGLSPDELKFTGRANTANGEVRTAPVRLESISVGGVVDTNMPAYVNEGEMFKSLLGMAYLQRWDKIEISDGKLALIR